MKKTIIPALAMAVALLVSCAQAPAAVTPAPTQAESPAAKSSTPEPVKAQSTESPAQEAANTSAPRPHMNVAALKGPTAMGMVGLMRQNGEGDTLNDYSFTLAGAADELTAMIAKDELDIAALPCNVASVLYNKTKGGVTLLAINTLGVLYIVENGDTVSSVADLKGKTVALMGKGTTPEFTLNYLIAQSGLKPGDVKLEFRSEATEIAAMLEQGAVSLAMLPEPYVTGVLSKNPGLRVALDVTEQWDLLGGENGGSLVTGTVVARTAFLKENEAAVRDFLKEYEASIAFTKSDPDSAARLIEDYGIASSAALAQKALPNCNIVFITGERMRQDVSSYLTVLFEQNPQSVGGKLPDDAFYYIN